MLLLITPAAAILLLFQVVPIVIGANASFRDWTLYDPKKTWVGLAHYGAVLTDRAFLTIVLPNTFVFMAVSVGASLVLGLSLALLLNRPFRGQKLVQTVVLEGLGFEGQPWMAQRWTAFSVVVLTDVWLWTPWFTLLLLAGLQSLPREPFEAAAIDGAGRWNTFRFVTVPLLRSIIVVCAVIRAIDAFRTFDIVWTLTGGGPGRSTELFSLYAYVYAFLNLDFGKGSAAAMIGAAIILVVGLGLFRALDRLVEVSR